MIRIERDAKGRHFINGSFISANFFGGIGWYKKKMHIQAVQMKDWFSVQTLEGEMTGRRGDWLAIGVAGEMYPIDAEIFEATYEKA